MKSLRRCGTLSLCGVQDFGFKYVVICREIPKMAILRCVKFIALREVDAVMFTPPFRGLLSVAPV